MPLSSLTLGIGVALLQILWNCRFDFINCQLNCNFKVLKTLIIPFCKNTFSVTMPFLYCFIEEFRFKLYTVFTLVAFSITIVSSYGSLFESFALQKSAPSSFTEKILYNTVCVSSTSEHTKSN